MGLEDVHQPRQLFPQFMTKVDKHRVLPCLVCSVTVAAVAKERRRKSCVMLVFPCYSPYP